MVEAIKILEMLNSICASFESYTEKPVVFINDIVNRGGEFFNCLIHIHIICLISSLQVDNLRFFYML